MKEKFKRNKRLVFSALILIPLTIVGIVRLNSKASIHEVVLTEEGFEPNELTIKKGDYVKFTTKKNEPFWPASSVHPIHDIYPEFDTRRPIDPNDSWTFRFTKEGVWEFHDHLFPYSRGKIIVERKAQVSGSSSSVSYSFLRKELAGKIKKLSTKSAYVEMKKDYQGYDFGSQHLAAHVFGELLYNEEGIDGILICDASFAFGCYHGIFSKAIAAEGTEVASLLDKVCVEKLGEYALGCPHGIGHGLGEYLGPQKLVEQLEVCERLTWKGPLLGCTSGVFMEYNFPTLFETDNVELATRKLEDDPYEPCSLIPKRFRESCYFEQGLWWQEVFKKDYQRIGKLCRPLKDGNEKKDCFMGIGSAAAITSSFNVSETLSSCSQMPTKDSEVFCKAGASWAFFAEDKERDKAPLLCDFKNEETKKTCLDISKLLAR